MKYRCIIVDDEPPAISILKKYIETIGTIDIRGTYTNALEAVSVLNTEHIDLLFLDINMPEITGTDLIKSVLNSPKVIFTTAHKDYAIEAFELNAIDYLLKPFTFERFLKAVNKFCSINAEIGTPGDHNRGFLYFRVDRKMVKVFLEDITYIESYKDYIIIHREKDPNLKVKYAIGSIENMLPHNLFLRIHRSFIVSVHKVTAFSNSDVEIGKIELPVSRNYPDIFRKLTRNDSLVPREK